MEIINLNVVRSLHTFYASPGLVTFNKRVPTTSWDITLLLRSDLCYSICLVFPGFQFCEDTHVISSNDLPKDRHSCGIVSTNGKQLQLSQFQKGKEIQNARNHISFFGYFLLASYYTALSNLHLHRQMTSCQPSVAF